MSMAASQGRDIFDSVVNSGGLLHHDIDGIRAGVERLIPGVGIDEVFLVADLLHRRVVRQFGRRHQKLIEESPAPRLSEEAQTAMCEAAVRLIKQANYTNNSSRILSNLD